MSLPVLCCQNSSSVHSKRCHMMYKLSALAISCLMLDFILWEYYCKYSVEIQQEGEERALSLKNNYPCVCYCT